MYLRITQRHNRDGSSVTYYALAESVWNAEAKRREAHVVHSFGRADQLDRAELERLVKSINRVLDDGDDAAGRAATSDRPEIEIEKVFELGVVLAARTALADLLIKSNQTEAGLDELRAASRLDAQNAAIWERIGDVEKSINHTAEARDAYATALKLETEKSDQKRIRTKMAF